MEQNLLPLQRIKQKLGVDPFMTPFAKAAQRPAAPVTTQSPLQAMAPQPRTAAATETVTAPQAPAKPVNWSAIRTALLKKYPSATKTQIEELDAKLKKAQTWESIKIGEPDREYLEEVRKTYPDLYSRAVAEGITAKQSDTTDNVLDVVDELLGRDVEPITGVLQIRANIPGTDAALTKNLYDQLKGILSLENRQQLKGSGAISDFEFKVLSQASTALDRNLSAKDFKKVLNDIKTAFSEEAVPGKPTTIGRFKVEVE